MPWNLGNFTRTNGQFVGPTVWQQDEAAAIDIDSDRHDVHDQDIATGINECLNKAGQNSPTADIPMGGNLLIGLGAGTAPAHSITLGQADAAYIQTDGNSTVTADIPFGGFKATGVGDGTDPQDAVTVGQVSSFGVNASAYCNGASGTFDAVRCTPLRTGVGVWQITWDTAGNGSGDDSSLVFISGLLPIGGSPGAMPVGAQINHTSDVVTIITIRSIEATPIAVDSEFSIFRLLLPA
jgi:hypothetical protein